MPPGIPAVTLAAVAATVVLAAGCSSVMEPGTPVGQDVVAKELAGKVWLGTSPNGASATGAFAPYGTGQIIGGLNDSGTWRYWEKGFCTQWRRMRNGEERGFTLDKTAG